MVEQLSPELAPFLHAHFSKRLLSYEQDSDGVTLHFADGSTARADILIGADGVGSPTRRTMYSNLSDRLRTSDPAKAEELLKVSQPSWTGVYIYRTLIDREKLRAEAPNNVMLDKMIIVSASYLVRLLVV